MTLPYFKLEARDVPDSEAQSRRMSRELTQVTARYHAITGGRFTLAKYGGDAFEAHLELLLPQHQVIVNATAATAERAAHEAVARALAQLAVLERRDPAVRSPLPAKAA